jgi:cyclopropane fatty-acyl-phospholipid synthase-like methyltransferase
MKDIKEFYSVKPELWLKILGEKCHYNVGIHDGLNDQSDNLIRSFYKFLNKNSKILDCGCGLGGTSRMLRDELGATVTSITNIKQHYDYLVNVLDKVICIDLEEFVPTENYDCALFVQSMTHIDNVDLVIKNLSNNVNKIIINDFYSYRRHFKDESWLMHFRTINEYKSFLEKNNFSVVEVCDITDNNSKKEKAKLTLNNINKLEEKHVKGQILYLKKLCLDWLKCSHSRDYGIATIYAVNKKCS